MGTHMAVEAADESQIGGMRVHSWRGCPEHSYACGVSTRGLSWPLAYVVQRQGLAAGMDPRLQPMWDLLNGWCL